MEDERDWSALTGMLLEAAGEHVAAQGHPMWVRVLDPPGGAEGDFSLAVSDEPNDLMGWVATEDCQAVGVVATGKMRPLPGAPAGFLDAPIESVRMACLVTRKGEVAWQMKLPDGVGPLCETAELPPSEGRMLDCLRRCFGLPTPPPPVGPALLQVIVWLAAILEETGRARPPLTWSEIARLHPVARVLSADLGGPGSELMTGLMRMAGSAWSWDDLRLQAQRDEFLEGIIEPELAGWMDAGMFARWVLSDLPSADEMFRVVRPYLTPSAARRLGHAMHSARSVEVANAVT